MKYIIPLNNYKIDKALYKSFIDTNFLNNADLKLLKEKNQREMN